MSSVSVLAASASDANNELWRWNEAGVLARSVRGHKMRTLSGLMDEVSAAFQFPWYYGENWAAFDECLADLEWMTIGSGIRMLVYSATQLLADEPHHLPLVARLFESIATEYAEPITGTQWDRPGVKFEVILQTEPDDLDNLLSTWRSAGIDLPPASL
jgi:hypothetical protein